MAARTWQEAGRGTAPGGTGDFRHANFVMCLPYHQTWRTHHLPLDVAGAADVGHVVSARASDVTSDFRVDLGDGTDVAPTDDDVQRHFTEVERLKWLPEWLGEPDDTERQHWLRRSRYFHSDRLREAVDAEGYSYWYARDIWPDGAWVLHEEEPFRLLAVERYEFFDDEHSPDVPGCRCDGCAAVEQGEAGRCECGAACRCHPYRHPGYLVLHFEADGLTAAELQRASEILRRPHKDNAVATLAAGAGVRVRLAAGGFTDFDKTDRGVAPVMTTRERVCPGWDWDRTGTGDTLGKPYPTYAVTVQKLHGEAPGGIPPQALERDPSQAFVVSLAVPHPGALSYPENLASRTRWAPEQAWTYQLATGMNTGRYFRLPANDPVPAERGAFLFEAAWGRAMRYGAAFVTEPDLPEARGGDGDVKAIRSLVHTVGVEVAMLAHRQRVWLDAHAERLADAEPALALQRDRAGGAHVMDGDESVRVGFAAYLDLEHQLNTFRNRLWFIEVPGRPEATTLLRNFQDAMESPNLLAECREEQKDILRIAELAKHEQDALRGEADERKHREREERERKRMQAESKRMQAESERRDTLNTWLAAFAVPSLWLAFAALLWDPSFGEVDHSMWWTIVGLVLSIPVALGIAGYLRRKGGRPDDD